MPVSIAMPSRPQQNQNQDKKRDIWDVVLTGLSAAGAFTNIVKARQEMNEIETTRDRQNRLEQQKLASDFVEVSPGTTGAVELEGPSGLKKTYLSAAGIEQGAKNLREQNTANIKNEGDLRDKWLLNPQTKTTQDVSAAVEKVRKIGSSSPSPAGDMSLVFSFMKLQDPGSTVREGEYANAQNAAGIPDKLRNMYNKMVNGEILQPGQRADFVNRSEQLYDVHYQKQMQFNKEFARIASEYKLDPNKVVLDLGFQPSTIKKGLTIPGQQNNEDIKNLNKNLESNTPVQVQEKLKKDVEEFNRLMGQ